MRIVVFGAGGRTGRLIVEQGLARGHEMVAAIRDPAGAALPPQNGLRVVAADVLDAASVDSAIVGADAVISAVGSGGHTPVRTYSEGGANIVTAMRRHGIVRIVAITSLGAGDDSTRFPNPAPARPSDERMRAVRTDMTAFEQALARTDLEWTVVRPAGLVDGPFDPSPIVMRRGEVPAHSRISRASVARLVLDEAESGRHADGFVAIMGRPHAGA